MRERFERDLCGCLWMRGGWMVMCEYLAVCLGSAL